MQDSTAVYTFSYVNWLQLAAEYVGCSQLMLMSPLRGQTRQKSSTFLVTIAKVNVMLLGLKCLITTLVFRLATCIISLIVIPLSL